MSDGGLDSLTEMQRAILDALQRPLREGGPYATPATNKEIAAAVHLSVDAVKGHLRAIYARLGLDELPQNAKRARLAEIGLSGALDRTLPPRPPEPVPALAATAPPARQRGRLPAMLAAVGLGLVLMGMVAGLMLARDDGDTIISQQPGFDEPGNPGQGNGGKGSLLGGLPGPWSDDGLFAAGPAVPAGYEIAPGTAGAAPVSNRTGDRARRRGTDRGQAKTERRTSARRPSGSSSPAAAPPTVTTTPTATRRARRTCTTRRQVTYRPRTVTVRQVRMVPRRVRVRVVRYRREVRMVPVQRQVPNGNGNHNGNGKRNNDRNGKNGKGGQGQGQQQGGGTHTETVYVRQVRRVPVVTYVTRTRMRRQVRSVRVTRRQRVVRSVRTCR